MTAPVDIGGGWTYRRCHRGLNHLEGPGGDSVVWFGEIISGEIRCRRIDEFMMHFEAWIDATTALESEIPRRLREKLTDDLQLPGEIGFAGEIMELIVERLKSRHG